MKCALYIIKDAGGVPLYAGVSANPLRRMAEHNSRSDFFLRSAEITLTWFDCREDALKAESAFIREHNPVGNKSHARRPRPAPSAKAGSVAHTLHSLDPCMNMEDWADRLGISRPYLYGLLDETRSPSLPVALRIAAATGGAVPITAWPKIAAVVDATDGAA